MPAENGKETKATVPYVPFKTFLSALDTLKHGLPNQIDRSVFPSLSGVIQGQVLSAFRFFGLIAPDGKPTPELAKVIEEKERQAQMKKLLEKGYPHLFALGLSNASPNSLDAELRKAGLSGDTHEKAKSFFLHAAKFAGVPLSLYLMKVTRATGKRKPRTPPKPPEDGNLPVPPVTRTTAPSMKTIQLDNGISLFLGASADLFAMASEDRKFVMELLDRIEQYEQDHPAEETEETGEEEEET
jgi:hypothetical protein